MSLRQMEDFEAELETLESGAKRSKKPPARVAHYRESLERCATSRPKSGGIFTCGTMLAILRTVAAVIG